MAFNVTLESPRTLDNDQLRVRAIMSVNMITLERFDEGLSRTARLQQSNRRESWCETDRLSDGYRPFGAAITVVVLETFDRMRQGTVLKRRSTVSSVRSQII
jgi:hypothetical protein